MSPLDLLAERAFLQRALLEALLVGLVAGPVGVHVLLRRLPFLTMAMAHLTFPGVVLASLAGVNLLLGSAVFGLVIVAAVLVLERSRRVDVTAAVGVTVPAGFALGALLVGLQPGFSRDLAAFLVGSIVTVQTADLIRTAVVAAVVLAVLTALHKEFVLGAFDPVGLRALGYPVLPLTAAFFLLLQLTIVAAVPAVGAILVVALLTAPAATARLWTDRIVPAMVLAALLGASGGVAGVLVSLAWRIAAGPAIVLVLAAFFLASLLLSPRHGLIARLLRPTVTA